MPTRSTADASSIVSASSGIGSNAKIRLGSTWSSAPSFRARLEEGVGLVSTINKTNQCQSPVGIPHNSGRIPTRLSATLKVGPFEGDGDASGDECFFDEDGHKQHAHTNRNNLKILEWQRDAELAHGASTTNRSEAPGIHDDRNARPSHDRRKAFSICFDGESDSEGPTPHTKRKLKKGRKVHRVVSDDGAYHGERKSRSNSHHKSGETEQERQSRPRVDPKRTSHEEYEQHPSRGFAEKTVSKERVFEQDDRWDVSDDSRCSDRDSQERGRPVDIQRVHRRGRRNGDDDDRFDRERLFRRGRERMYTKGVRFATERSVSRERTRREKRRMQQQQHQETESSSSIESESESSSTTTTPSSSPIPISRDTRVDRIDTTTATTATEDNDEETQTQDASDMDTSYSERETHHPPVRLQHVSGRKGRRREQYVAQDPLDCEDSMNVDDKMKTKVVVNAMFLRSSVETTALMYGEFLNMVILVAIACFGAVGVRLFFENHQTRRTDYAGGWMLVCMFTSFMCCMLLARDFVHSQVISVVETNPYAKGHAAPMCCPSISRSIFTFAYYQYFRYSVTDRAFVLFVPYASQTCFAIIMAVQDGAEFHHPDDVIVACIIAILGGFGILVSFFVVVCIRLSRGQVGAAGAPPVVSPPRGQIEYVPLDHIVEHWREVATDKGYMVARNVRTNVGNTVDVVIKGM